MNDDTRLIDITRTIHPDMAIYPNNPGVTFEQTQRAGEGKNSLSNVSLGTHTGTHIDTPAHIHDGGQGALAYSLEQLCGPCVVVDVTDAETVISAEQIPVTEHGRVLFKTKNSAQDPDTFSDEFVALDDSAAAACVERGFTVVGLDALSIRRRGTENQVHETLIDNDVVIIEGLWLAAVEPGEYELLCLPIKWDLDGAPARCALRPL